MRKRDKGETNREERLGVASRQTFTRNTAMRAEGVFESAFKMGVIVAEEQTIFLNSLGKGPFEIDRIPVNLNGGWGNLRR